MSLSGPLDTRFREGVDIPATLLDTSTGEIGTLLADGFQKPSIKTTGSQNVEGKLA